MQKIFYSNLLFIFCLSLNSFSLENTGAVSGSLGAAGVGTLEEADGSFLNPASIAGFSKKSFSISYSKFHTNIQISDHGREAFFPAGIAFTKTEENNIKIQGYHLLLAYPLATRIFFGIDGMLREIQIHGIDEKYRQTVITSGIFYQASEGLSLGFAWKNKPLTDTNLLDSLDKNSSLTFGFSTIYEKFAKFRADIESYENEKTDKLIYKLGLETYLNDWIITRIGYQNDNAYSLNFLTAGLGFSGPQFGLHYSYQAEARNQRDTLHTIDLNIPF